MTTKQKLSNLQSEYDARRTIAILSALRRGTPVIRIPVASAKLAPFSAQVKVRNILAP